MNMTDLAEHVAGEHGMPKSEAQRVVRTILDGISRAVADGEKVSLAGFGVFERVFRAARETHNPATGGKVAVPEKHVVKFRGGALLNERANVSLKQASGE